MIDRDEISFIIWNEYFWEKKSIFGKFKTLISVFFDSLSKYDVAIPLFYRERFTYKILFSHFRLTLLFLNMA